MKKCVLLCLVLLISFIFVSEVSANMYTISESVKVPEIEINNEPMTCSEILGPDLTKLVHFGINLLRLVAALIAIVNGMFLLVVPILNKDTDSLSKALNKLVRLFVILIVILILPSLIRLIGHILEFDLSCFF